jgi:hypothetical protein
MLFGRELDRLSEEVAAYPGDAELWSTVGAQKNSAGTLALHMVGNLSAYVGAALGGSGYVRDRNREFSEREVPRSEVVRRIGECRTVVTRTLEELDDEVLAGDYPGELPAVFEGGTTRGFLLHLLWHTGWHTGQVYYHRLGIEQASPD